VSTDGRTSASIEGSMLLSGDRRHLRIHGHPVTIARFACRENLNVFGIAIASRPWPGIKDPFRG
ncbi:hypothetical protein, partial [Nonomuraea rhizosphaerae]|uniref:hypothetical protein n=1 Tax=Nonomuraea rhizosphaerae TaxID=2665663 RepID=UPI001C60657C